MGAGLSPAGYFGAAAALLPEDVLLTVDFRHTSRRSKCWVVAIKLKAKVALWLVTFFRCRSNYDGLRTKFFTIARARAPAGKTAKMKRMRGSRRMPAGSSVSLLSSCDLLDNMSTIPPIPQCGSMEGARAHREWQGSCWNLTPSLPPPQLSSLRFRSPEFYEIVRQLVPVGGWVHSQLGQLFIACDSHNPFMLVTTHKFAYKTGHILWACDTCQVLHNCLVPTYKTNRRLPFILLWCDWLFTTWSYMRTTWCHPSSVYWRLTPTPTD